MEQGLVKIVQNAQIKENVMENLLLNVYQPIT